MMEMCNCGAVFADTHRKFCPLNPWSTVTAAEEKRFLELLRWY
jgi:hypothetical protein